VFFRLLTVRGTSLALARYLLPMADRIDWREHLPAQASLVFPIEEGESVFAAYAEEREDGVVMAHLHVANQGGSMGAGVPLAEIASRSYRRGEDAGFVDDGHYRVDRSVGVELTLAETAILVDWARRELGLVDLSLGPRQRLSPLAI
jgi:hypothetical protein